LERVVIGGDLSKLSTGERLTYYSQVCQSVGLNPLTRPFEYITLNGKLTLYARRDATDQLRSLKNVSVEIKSREVVEGCYVVTAGATMKDRHDESIGAVVLGDLKGEARANAIMKAETKAKRRVTLSICGLGLLDETEVETIPGASHITPNAGAGEGMTNKEKQVVADTAALIKDAIAESRESDAYGLAVTIEDNEGKLYLWSLLDSKERAAIKRQQEAERRAGAAKAEA